MKAALRMIYPPQCLCCGAVVVQEGALCPDCWRDCEFIGGCVCMRCGVPLPGAGWEGEAMAQTAPGVAAAGTAAALICDDCLRAPPPWQQGRAALAYRGTGRRLVLALKHGDRPDLAPYLGEWLARAAADLVRPGMIVAPVPLHPLRLLKRKYNQAALVSGVVARRHALIHAPALLRRLRATPPQDRRSRDDRFANLAGAIAVGRAPPGGLGGRAVLLVDDVMASGATLDAAARALAGADAGPVVVATLARAVRD